MRKWWRRRNLEALEPWELPRGVSPATARMTLEERREHRDCAHVGAEALEMESYWLCPHGNFWRRYGDVRITDCYDPGGQFTP